MIYHLYRFHAMGSPCSAHVYANSEAEAIAAAQRIESEVNRLEKKYSRYRNDSLTAALRVASQQGTAIRVDSETAALLDYAHAAWEESDGLFDITAGVLRHAWNFQSNQIPTQACLESVLPRVGWQHVHWRESELSFSRPGMEIDFGGFVKEYAADCAAAIAWEAGIQAGLVELGGDIRVIGPHPDGRPWAIGIRHPHLPGQVWATISLSKGALASSGDYERCVVHNGVRYGHVLNPRTGWPVQGLSAVSAVADHCLLAGAITTMALLQGEQGVEWLQTLDQPWLAMNQVGEVFGTLCEASE